ERANHARELVTGISLDEWDGIVTVSGDGLLYEVVNGLMDRPDWAAALRMPLGILPCGSGNALAAAINFHAGLAPALGLSLLQNCAVLLCRGTPSPLDLVSVTTASGTRVFSFLSVAWGLVADVDIESERLRRLGPARFALGTAARLLALHTYRGRLSYLPAVPRSATADAADTSPPSPSSPPGGPVDDLLVPLGQPVPPSWVTLEGDFILVLAIYQSHLGAELVAAPRARPDDGLIHLCYVRAGVSRGALLRALLAMTRGGGGGGTDAAAGPPLSRVPARAFRLEPLTPRGVLTVDGERVEYGPLQG
ncbi:SPHK1 kinase, partial [Haliaeetus albicilla]|nr:SPHK1 kinase [Haliaeetus albicilla]